MCNAYSDNGIRFWDALDPDLFARVVPRTGDQFAISQVADLTYKRLDPLDHRACRWRRTVVLDQP